MKDYKEENILAGYPRNQTGRALPRHHRGHGFKSRSSLNFFQVFSQQSGCVDNCENLFFFIKSFDLNTSRIIHIPKLTARITSNTREGLI